MLIVQMNAVLEKEHEMNHFSRGESHNKSVEFTLLFSRQSQYII